jgi:hypothetical protein
MIIEKVTFRLPQEMTRAGLIKKYRQTVPKWRENQNLLQKSYIYDPSEPLGGGIYIWKNKVAAEQWHDSKWRAQFAKRWDTEPKIEFYETLIVVDNIAQEIIEDPTTN